MLWYEATASQLQRILSYATYRWDENDIRDAAMKTIGKLSLNDIITAQSVSTQWHS